MTLKGLREEGVGVALDEGVVRGLTVRIRDMVIGIKRMIVRTNGVTKDTTVKIEDVMIRIKVMMAGIKDMVKINDGMNGTRDEMVKIKDMTEIKDGMIGTRDEMAKIKDMAEIKDGMIGTRDEMVKIKDMAEIKDIIVRISGKAVITDGTGNNALTRMVLGLGMTSQVIVDSREGLMTRNMALRM